MDKNTNIICTTCPMGCTLAITHQGKEIIKVEGNQCNRGLKYAEAELKDPRRVVTTVIKVHNGIYPLVPACTTEPLPKNIIFKLLNDLRNIEIEAPVQSGQLILKNVYNTGIDVIASRDLPQKEHSA